MLSRFSAFFRNNKVILAAITTALALPIYLAASGEAGAEHGHDITHSMMMLVFELGIIIFAAKLAGMAAEKVKLPSVLGELLIGVLIGPYMLGGVSIPGFEEGIFAMARGSSAIPVSPELYGIATIASIILLFGVGLETDFEMFLKYSAIGFVIGVSGFIISFMGGSLLAMAIIDGVDTVMHPVALFFGIMSTPTSVGITARILSEKKKMDSPEGVSIMAGAVIDDILGIIILAVVVGVSAMYGQSAAGASPDWGNVIVIAAKAIGVWLAFTAAGIIFAYRISRFLKMFKSVTVFSILSLGLALILAGIFEKAGLAMIVGAYVMGLSLSRTDLSYVIHDNLNTIRTFFVPIFFTVMGMLVNPAAFLSKEVLILGALYSVAGILTKLIGCGLPTFLLGFNHLGAMRIGAGMLPRGEVILIMAGVALSRGYLPERYFGVVIMLILITALLTPPVLNALFSKKKRGTTKASDKKDNSVTTVYDFPTMEITELLESKIVDTLREEGFFINIMTFGQTRVYNVRKDEIALSLHVSENRIEFIADKEDIAFIKNIMYEAALEHNNMVSKLTALEKPAELKKEIAGTEGGRTNTPEIRRHLNPDSIIVDLKGESKEEVIRELAGVMHKNGEIEDVAPVMEAVMERERSMSTGLANGFAIPHAKCEAVQDVRIAVGLKREGVEFGSMDKKPARIIVMVLSPKSGATAHIQTVAALTSIFSTEEKREKIFELSSGKEVHEFLSEKK